MRGFRLALAAVAVVTLAQSASAQKMFIRDPAKYLGYGYGGYSWTEMTGKFDAKFGAGNIDQGSAIGSLAGYSALFLDPSQPGTSAYNLSAGEVTEIQNFLLGGGRLYTFGENDNWAPWNTDIMSLFGGSASGTGADFGTTLVSNGLTAGVASIDTPAPGEITDFNGGVDLFSNHIAGLFNDDAIVVLDINICDDSNINRNDNRQFCQNIVDFTAGAPVNPTSTPEPASLALMGTGLLSLGGVAARRRKARSAK